MLLTRTGYSIRRSHAADAARICGGLALPVLALGGLGTRVGIVPEPALLSVVTLGFLLALVALGLATYALYDIWNSGAEGAGAAIAGIVYSSPAVAVLALVAAAAIYYPRLADVSTDVEKPPVISGLSQWRAVPEASARKVQVASYPDIKPRLYPLPLSEVHGAARKLMLERGWTITQDSRPAALPLASRGGASAAIPIDDQLARVLARKSVMTQSRSGAKPAAPQGTDAVPLGPSNFATLQASAQTLVFGFVDLVALRFVATPNGTRVDMRSVSQVGEHDLGQNARRIGGFFDDLDEALQPGGPGVSGFAVLRR